MRRLEVFGLLLVALVLSTIAPAILFASGVTDAELLAIVFFPSVLVGWNTALVARRRPAERVAWMCDSRRMP